MCHFYYCLILQISLPQKMAFAENHQAYDEPEWQRNIQESNDLEVFSIIVKKVEPIHISIDTL